MSANAERVMRPNRLKLLGLLALSAAFVAVGVWMIVEGDWRGWLSVGFFGLCALVFLVVMLPGSAYLRLDAEGFRFCSMFRSRLYKWSDVDCFGVAVVGLNKMVVFNFSSQFDRAAFGRKMSAALCGWEAALPDTYGLSAEALADLLNEYKKASWLAGKPAMDDPTQAEQASAEGIRPDTGQIHLPDAR